MNKIVREYVENNPYYQGYKEKEKEYEYLFCKDGKCFSINLWKEFDFKKHYFPIYLLDVDEGVITFYWDMPDWIKKIEIEMNQLYFKSVRLKMAVENQAIHFANILFYHSYFEKNGEQFWNDLSSNNLEINGSIYVGSEFIPILERAKEVLKKHGYDIIVLEKSNKRRKEMVSFRIVRKEKIQKGEKKIC